MIVTLLVICLCLQIRGIQSLIAKIGTFTDRAKHSQRQQFSTALKLLRRYSNNMQSDMLVWCNLRSNCCCIAETVPWQLPGISQCWHDVEHCQWHCRCATPRWWTRWGWRKTVGICRLKFTGCSAQTTVCTQLHSRSANVYTHNPHASSRRWTAAVASLQNWLSRAWWTSNWLCRSCCQMHCVSATSLETF